MAKLNSSRIYGNLIVDSTINGVGLTSGSNTFTLTSGTATLVRSGAHALTLTTTGATNVTLPTGTVTLATTAALDLKANLASPTFTGTVSGITATMVGLGNVTNESKATMFTSPTFTGTPIAPTAASGTNTTQVATTAFVQTAVSGLVDAAPGTLDTLNELAAALGDDPNFATTVSNSIGTKVTANTAITAGTATKITYDTKGLVTSGTTLAAADIPNLDAGKITSGTFADARIPDLNASKITAGTFGVVRGGTGATTLASGEVLIGAGTGAVTTLSRSGIDSRASFPPSAHTHAIGDVTNLQTSLDAKANLSGATFTGAVNIQGNKLNVGNVSGDDYIEISQYTGTSAYGFTTEFSNASTISNQQGGTNQFLILGDNSTTSTTGTLLGVSILESSTYTTRLDLKGNGDLSFSGTLTGGTVPWARLSNIPSTFTPSAHTHVKADITDFAHTHAIADVTGLQTALDGKLGTGAKAADSDLLDGFNSSVASTANTVVVRDANAYIYGSFFNSSRADQTTAAASYIYDTGDGWMRKKTLANAQTEIVTSEAVTAHAPSKTGTGASGTWGISVTGSAATLTTARNINGVSFNGSADITITANPNAHTHAAADTTSGTFDVARIPNLSASKITSGTIDVARLPAIAITDVFTGTTLANFVSTVYSLDTSGLQEGDILILTTDNQTYVHNGGTAGTSADFTLLRTPTDLVTSVAGKQGVVTLVKGDVGLGSVDNTADNTKTVANANRWTSDRTITIGNTGKTVNGTGNVSWTLAEIGATNNTGTVTSVGLSLPTSVFTGTGSVTTSGTLTREFANQSANTVFAGPNTGLPGVPAFRTLVADDLPTHTHAASAIISGVIATARLGTGTPSSSNFLRGDGSWSTTGDVVGPASSVANRFATFNGTTGKLIQDSGFTTANIAGNSNTTVWNPQNLSIPMYSTAVGWYTTNVLSGITFTQRLGSNVSTAVNTTAVQVFSFTNLAAGTYQFFTTGRIDKVGSTSSRRYEVYFTCDNTTNYSNILGYASFSPNTTDNSGVGLSTLTHTTFSTATSSITSLIGQGFVGTTATTAVSGMVYNANGTFTIAGTRDFRMHIRQSAGSSTDIVRVQSGSFMNLYRIS
jgi:hypothetical protein